MKTEQRFCPICKTHHDPNVVCTDRAGELLRAAGIEQKPMTKKEFEETAKKADRSLLMIILVFLAAFLLGILFLKLK
jgi:hypothetical protein